MGIFDFWRSEKRMNQNDWAAEMFTYNGNAYPIGQMFQTSANAEHIENDFSGYVNQAFKRSGVVYACVVARVLLFSEARFQYQRMNNGRPGDLFGTKDLEIFEKPWPNAGTGELLARALSDVDLAGNHYMLREGYGANSRLRRLRPDWVDIVLTAPPEEAVQSDVAGYLYKPGNTQDPDLWEMYPIDGSRGVVAHWSPIVDPEAQYRGMSWITPVLTEIMIDKGATKHKQKFFDNGTTPSLAISFKETVSKEQFKAFKEAIDTTKTGVDNAYQNLYLGGGADVKVIGSTLAQMDFKTVQGHVETRIMAAARINPVIVGIDEGFTHSALTQDNFMAAKNQFADGTMRPMWRSLCQAYSVLVPEQTQARLWWDDRDIAWLREDRQALADLRQSEAATLSGLISSGFTPDSAVAALVEGDWNLLEHTGMFSVQLLPPGTTPQGGAAPDGSPTNANAPTKPSKPSSDANTPDAADKGNSKKPPNPES